MTSTYADRIQGVQSSVAVKAPVRVATTANITLSGTQTIDGVSVVVGDRVLVKNQDSGPDNGIWVVASGAWSRATDWNGARDIVKGTQVFVASGTANASRTFFVSTADPVVGSSSITFAGTDAISGLAATAETLTAGSPATASFDYDTNTLTLGIPRGATGATGPQGDAGTGIQFKGTVADEASLPSSGNTTGDAYITEDNSHLFIWDGSAWSDGGDLQGPAGIDGSVYTFQTRGEAVAATIPAPVQKIAINHWKVHCVFVRDTNGTALTTADGAKWSPTYDHITPLHWGARGNGIADDTAYVQAALDFIAARAWDNKFIDDVKRTYGGRLALTGGDAGKVYAISAPFRDIPEEAAHAIVKDICFIAIGDWVANYDQETVAREFTTVAGMIASASNVVGDYVRTANYSTGDGRGEVYEIIDDADAVDTDDITVIQLTGVAAKAKRVNITMFDAAEVAAYTDFENVRINCNDKCGGIKLQARCRAVGCWIDQVRHVGIIMSGSDTWVDRCIIGQWTQNDVEYYDKDRYTGVGIWFRESDGRVTSTTVRWLHVLMDIESTDNIISHCHMFNGMPSYVVDDGRDAARNNAIDAYFGWASGTAAVTDMPRRTSHIGIRTGFCGATWFMNTDIDNVYFDNCHHELYVDGLTITNIKFADKAKASPLSAATLGGNTVYGDAPTKNYWFRLHAWDVGVNSNFVLRGLTSFVAATYKQLVVYTASGGNSWAHDYTNFNADQEINTTQRNARDVQAMQSFHLLPPYTHVYPSDQGPAVSYYGLGGTVRLGFKHEETDAWSELRVVGTGGADRMEFRPRGTTRFEVSPTYVKARLVDLVVETFTDTYLKILADRADTSNLAFGDQDDEDIGLISYDHATEKFTIKTGAADRVSLNATGLGIGTTSPTAPLDVAGGKIALAGVSIGAASQVIADDAVGTFTPPKAGGFAYLGCNAVGSPVPANFAHFAYDTGSSLQIEKASGFTAFGADVDVTNTDVTGTTGTDGKVTISVQSGVVKVENRSGGSRAFAITWL